jgi:four helix bundle protein
VKEFPVLGSQLAGSWPRLISGSFWERRNEKVPVTVEKRDPLQETCTRINRGYEMGQSYRELIAWQKAMDLVTEIYRATSSFPREEQYGLTNQLRRAAVSVPSNIAEGQARFSQREFHRFLGHARGSLVEIETQLMIACNLEYLSAKQSHDLLDKTAEVGRIMNGLIASIRAAA